MQRCYIKPEAWTRDALPLTSSEQHHLMDVLRISAGATLLAFNGQGKEAIAKLRVPAEHPDGAYLEIMEELPVPSGAQTPQWILMPAIIKGSRMDSLIEKATELGATRIMPIQTDRCVVRLDANQATKKMSRWERIAVSAAKQCGTPHLPHISAVSSLRDGLHRLQEENIPILQGSLEGTSKPLATVAKQWISEGKNQIAILVGPEGDFTPAEYALSKSAGCRPVSFGALTLRAETATIYALSVLQALWNATTD